MAVGVWQRPPVLIVSGHVGAQDVYVRFLRDLRIPVVGVDTVDEASLALRHFPVRAALFDVVRPADWDACRRLRDRLPTSIPVLVLSGTGSADGDGRRLAQRIGCSGLLAKPCPPEILVSALDRATVGESWTEFASGG
jgi:CheY-like chemotaxis protein